MTKIHWLREVLLYGLLGALITITLIGMERNRLRDETADFKTELFQEEVREFMNRGDRYTAAQAYEYCIELSKHAVILGQDPLNCHSILENTDDKD